MPTHELPRCQRCRRPTTKLYRLELVKVAEADVALEDQDTGRQIQEAALAYDGQGPSYCIDCRDVGVQDAVSLILVRIIRQDRTWTRLPDRWLAELRVYGPAVEVADSQPCKMAGVVVLKAVATDDPSATKAESAANAPS